MFFIIYIIFHNHNRRFKSQITLRDCFVCFSRTCFHYWKLLSRLALYILKCSKLLLQTVEWNERWNFELCYAARHTKIRQNWLNCWYFINWIWVMVFLLRITNMYSWNEFKICCLTKLERCSTNSFIRNYFSSVAYNCIIDWLIWYWWLIFYIWFIYWIIKNQRKHFKHFLTLILYLYNMFSV